MDTAINTLHKSTCIHWRTTRQTAPLLTAPASHTPSSTQRWLTPSELPLQGITEACHDCASLQCLTDEAQGDTRWSCSAASTPHRSPAQRRHTHVCCSPHQQTLAARAANIRKRLQNSDASMIVVEISQHASASLGQGRQKPHERRRHQSLRGVPMQSTYHEHTHARACARLHFSNHMLTLLLCSDQAIPDHFAKQ
jgi:hypothetical protein